MSTDTFGTVMWIIFALAMLIYGIVGIFRGEIHFRLGRGGKGIPISLTGQAGLASSTSLIVGGALLIIGTRPLNSGLEQVISAVGCVVPIVVVSFCYIMQTLVNIGSANYKRKNTLDEPK